MIYTNKYNIPETIARAIINDPYIKEGDFTVTELIKPPQIRVLEKRHRERIEVDVSEGLWRLLGQAIHYILERGEHEGVLKEERLFLNVNGITLSGKADLYHKEHESVEDYKVTSVWSYLSGNKAEWEAQLNLNRLLFIHAGFNVRRLKIHAILRDWQRSKVNERDYPPIPFVTFDIPLWDEDTATTYLRDRIRLHLEAEELPDELLPPCTSEEQWYKPPKFALMKVGKKIPIKVFDHLAEAIEAMINANLEDERKSYCLERRVGQRVRCEGYCSVRAFCHQYKYEKGGKNEKDL